MRILALVFYELQVRFRIYTAWKLVIGFGGLGATWIGWQAAIILIGAYSTMAAFLAPEGNRPGLTLPGSPPELSAKRPSIFDQAQYSWNAPGYHNGTGTPSGPKQMPQGEATLYKLRDNECAKSPCFKLVIYLKEAINYPLPTEAEIQAAFGGELAGNLPDEMYGHSPYRQARDQIEYHYDSTLFLGSLGLLTGYSHYDRTTTEQIKADVIGFLERYGPEAETLYCGYKSEGNAKWQYKAVYWYKKRPPGTEHDDLKRRFGEHHPLLFIRDPVDICPPRYEEKSQ